MPTFAGTWITTRYSANDPLHPEIIRVVVAADSQLTDHFDGHYERPGPDAALHGAVEAEGTLWRATISEPHVQDSGSAVFFLAADGNTLHGAWTSNQHSQGPQPWFGYREP